MVVICVISYFQNKKQSVMTTISSAFLSVFLLLHMGCIKRTDQRQQFFITNSNPNNQQNVITMSKRSGIQCRSVCGKCEQILGQSWSLRCQHDCLHGGVPFLVCLKVTSYRGISQHSTHKRRTYPDQVSIAHLTVKCMPTTQTSNQTSN